MRLVSQKWKCGTAIAVCVVAIALGQVGYAQDAKPAEQKAPQAEQKAPPVPMIMPRMPIPALKNIQVEITIIDQVGSEPPVKKTLSVIAVDGGSGAVRSKATLAVPRQKAASEEKDYLYEDLPLNVDIRPEITENKNRIRARLTMNYETFSSPKATNAPATRSIVFVDQHVMLDNGKPMIVSQSADATTDRKVSVELKATILP